MMGLMVVLLVFFAALLIGCSAIRIRPPEYSTFELGRRKKRGDDNTTYEARRVAVLDDLLSLQRVLSALLLVVTVAFSVAVLGWLVGVLVAVLLALEYGALARLPILRKYAQKYYDQFEPTLVSYIERYPRVVRAVRTISVPRKDEKLHSREELLHLVKEAGTVLTTDEKSLIEHGLAFRDKAVRDVMTPRSVIDSVKKTEILGPLVLDDLHKTGHNRFPVIDGDIDHVVGVLHVRDLLTLDTARRHTSKVESAMEARVFYVYEEQTLTHALAAFLKTHHHLFVVVNEYRETVGLLSLEDVIEAMLGRPIIDEFDTHDDLRAVAVRNPRGNNTSKTSTDV